MTTPANLPAKKFAWSWSRLKNYRSCPKRHYHLEIAKDVKEPESEAVKWGHRFHDMMAQYIAKGTPLPITMQRYEKLAKLARDRLLEGKDVQVELKLAIDEQYRPSEWFDRNTWFRAVIDVQYLDPPMAAAIDWKTGQNIEPEYEQLGLNAGVIFAFHPEIEFVHTYYHWAAFDAETAETLTRADTAKLWAKLLPEVREMEEAARTLTYPPKPSGLCIRHCPVMSCPYFGKGNR
jgi:hypothetical protein